MTTNNGEPPDLLRRLSRLHPTMVVFGALTLFLAVLVLPNAVGAVLVLAIVAGLGWLLTKTWRVLLPAARGMRLLVIGLLLLIAVYKLTAI